jgi:hypothetical protein
MIEKFQEAGRWDAEFGRFRRLAMDMARADVRNTHRCLVAAGRLDEAAQAQSAARALDPRSRS